MSLGTTALSTSARAPPRRSTMLAAPDRASSSLSSASSSAPSGVARIASEAICAMRSRSLRKSERNSAAVGVKISATIATTTMTFRSRSRLDRLPRTKP